jgi:hypothetical protein
VFSNAHNSHVYVPLLTGTVFFAAQHLTKHTTLDRQTAHTASNTATGKGFSILVCVTVQDSGQWCIEQRDI